MKRLKFIEHLAENGCTWYREGGNHTLYFNPLTKKVVAIPRHSDIPDILCKEICKQLDIPKIK